MNLRDHIADVALLKETKQTNISLSLSILSDVKLMAPVCKGSNDGGIFTIKVPWLPS